MELTPGFIAFWAAWPSNTKTYARKGGRSECFKRWKAQGLENQAQEIIRHVEYMATTEAWQKDYGAFIPAPLVYINQARWDGADIPIAKPVAVPSNVYSLRDDAPRVFDPEARARAQERLALLARQMRRTS